MAAGGNGWRISGYINKTMLGLIDENWDKKIAVDDWGLGHPILPVRFGSQICRNDGRGERFGWDTGGRRGSLRLLGCNGARHKYCIHG